MRLKTCRLLIPVLVAITVLVSGTGHSQGMLECDEHGDCTLIELGLKDSGSGEETGSTLAVASDLEPGFPVRAFHCGGTYYGGPSIHTLVGNIDDDRELEIVATGLAKGPLYAWNHDGAKVTGWPVESL
jgi:hypothetical protein